MAVAGDFRISGLASGYDTAQLIEQLIAIERRPVLQMQKRQDRIKARSDAWRDITTRLSNLKSKISSLKLAGTMNAKSASSSDDKLLTAAAEPGAANSVYKIWVDQLATSTRVTSGRQVGRELDLGVKLSEAGFAITPTVGTFTINGVAIRINADTVMSDGVDNADSNSIFGKINHSGAGVTASVEENRLVLRAEPDAEPIRLGSGGDTSNFLTAAKVLGIPAGDTITSYGALGVARTTAALNKARLAAGMSHSITGGVAEGEVEGKLATALEEGTTVTFTYRGEEYTTSALSGGDDMELIAAELQAKMNEAAGLDSGVIRVRISGLEGKANDRFVITDTAEPMSGDDAADNSIMVNEASDALKLTLADGATTRGMFKINGVAIQYDANRDAINDIINRINASTANVTAAYDGLSDRLVLTSKETGGLTVTMDDVGGNFLAAVGLAGAEQEYGKSALFRIDGVQGGVQLSSASNTVSGVLTNVTLDLREVSDDPVTLTVSQNVDSAYNAVRGFVDQYGSTMDLLSSLTAYDKETKTAGALQGNSAVRGIQTSLRRLAMVSVEGQPKGFDSLLAIGISTGAPGKAGSRTGALTIDEAKLKEALRTDPQSVLRLFNEAEQGISVQYEKYIDELVKSTSGLISQTQNILKDQTREIDRRIQEMEARLEKRKESLVRQYTQMEKALAAMYQQQMWMDSQFNSMGIW